MTVRSPLLVVTARAMEALGEELRQGKERYLTEKELTDRVLGDLGTREET